MYIGLEDGVYMSTQDAATRQDLIENGVERELLPIQKNISSPQDLGSALQSQVEHDLIVWPREYLETYLDTGRDGTVPLNQAQLQDILEAAFDRDEELARNALSSLKKSLSERPSATLTVSLDEDASDRTAHPVLVNRMRAEDSDEPRYALRIENDAGRSVLRRLLENTAAVVERRALLEALARPRATATHLTQWYASDRTWDRSGLFDIASQPTVANEPAPIAGRPGLFESPRKRLRGLLHAGRGKSDNSQASARVNPEFREENSRYVAEYEPNAATVRLHDKRTVEDERVAGPAFNERSVESADTIKIATEKDLPRKADKDRSSMATAMSQLSDSARAAIGRADLVQRRRQAALTDSGVYSGKIVSETPELVVQRISAATEIAHPKSLFAEIPQIGQLVRIAYQNNVASVRELQPRKLEKELAR